MQGIRRYIGDRAFYRHTLAVMLPILAQNIVSNLISSLDNMMTGPLGTAEMSGVSVVNQLLFVFNWCLFGMVSGAGIFAAQAHGRRDREERRDSDPRNQKSVTSVTKVSGGRRNGRGGNPDRTIHQLLPYALFCLSVFAAVSYFLRDFAGLADQMGWLGNLLPDFRKGVRFFLT